MDQTIPAPAVELLNFIAYFEAPKGYDTVYGNNMGSMPKALTSMTLVEVIADGPRRKRAYGSSASGRYQFMTDTLKGLRDELKLTGNERFTPDLQDRLGFHLLKRRGYTLFVTGARSVVAMGLGLAQEWASFPVLADCQGASRTVARGQSYYAGDGKNKALVSAAAVEACLYRVQALAKLPATPLAPESLPETVAAAGAATSALPVSKPAVIVTGDAAPPPKKGWIQTLLDWANQRA